MKNYKQVMKYVYSIIHKNILYCENILIKNECFPFLAEKNVNGILDSIQYNIIQITIICWMKWNVSRYVHKNIITNKKNIWPTLVIYDEY